MRGDYQHDNRNSLSWVFLNSVAKYQIPTIPGLEVNGDVLPLLQAQDPTFTPVASQAVNQNQKENSQYTHLVWRHDVNAETFLSAVRLSPELVCEVHDRPVQCARLCARPADGESEAEGLFARDAARSYVDPNKQHLVKTGFQFEYTHVQNNSSCLTSPLTGTGLPIGPVLSQNAANTNVQTRQEFWIQDQWSPTDQWTLNLGVRGDVIQGFYNEGQVSPRIGVTYKLNQSNVFHAYYGRLFTPPNVEQIAFTKVNLQGTTAQPEDPTGFSPRAERANYFEVGSYHALTNWATLELTAYYKRSHFQSDAGSSARRRC